MFFAGLPKTCEIIEGEHKGFIRTFRGGESVRESLTKMGVPEERIPKDILEGSLYDDLRMEFGKDIINSGEYDSFKPVARPPMMNMALRKILWSKGWIPI